VGLKKSPVESLGLERVVPGMEELFGGKFSGRTVFITGHTGFVGSWMTLWLKELGANLVGYSLEPPSVPSLFELAGLEKHIDHHHGDVRDLDSLKKAMALCKPDYVFHLAAQALVKYGYEDPVTTYGTNVMGAVNFLEAVRECPSVRVCQVITSDKCYENLETGQPYREGDPLGGRDPYSSSKAAAELVTASYRRSFLHSGLAVSTVRAGNIIGGGDWGKDRILPDCVSALQADRKITVRNPAAVRPWQYVLEPVSGYLHLASLMAADPDLYSGPWNFGPTGKENTTVGEIADGVVRYWGSGAWESEDNGEKVHEAKLLNLDVGKATELLKWRPVYDTEQALDKTVQWYRKIFEDPETIAHHLCLEQVRQYVEEAHSAGLSWAEGGG